MHQDATCAMYSSLNSTLQFKIKGPRIFKHKKTDEMNRRLLNLNYQN
jgi:hypothetical protein